MISYKCIEAYRNQYPKSDIGADEGLGSVCIYVKNGYRVVPDDETDEIFLDRLERSKKTGKNLFLKECEFISNPPEGAYI